MAYKTFPILMAARKSGLPVEDRGLRQLYVNCPFCGDRKRRLYLYTDTDQYHCFNCRAHGNAVDLYARRTELSYAAAYHELLEDSLIHFPKPAAKLPPEREPAPLPQRDIVYRAMLGLLPLSAAHRDNLLSRGLTDSAIRHNGYHTLAFGKELRDYIAAQLSSRFDLNGIPGFFYSQGAWRLCAYSGLLVPVRAANGCVQGIQIRRDDAAHMKYAWMSSAGKPYGTGARSWVHVAGDRSRKEAVITEGPIKGDVSSALTGGGLFVCLPGVNAISFLPDTLRALGVRRAWEAFDMDKRNNAQVANAAERLREELKKAGIPCRTMAWDPTCKGIDDYLAMKRSAYDVCAGQGAGRRHPA